MHHGVLPWNRSTIQTDVVGATAAGTCALQVVTADGHRVRQRNYDECVGKLADIMAEAATAPKDWNKQSKTAEKFNARRLQEKKMQGEKKKARSRSIDY